MLKLSIYYMRTKSKRIIIGLWKPGNPCLINETRTRYENAEIWKQMNELSAAAKTTACKSSHSLPDDLHDTQLTICRCGIFWHMQSCRKWDTVHNGGLLHRGGGLSIHQSSRWPQHQKSFVSAILFKDWKQKSTSQHFLSYRLLHDLVSLKCKNWSWGEKKQVIVSKLW